MQFRGVDATPYWRDYGTGSSPGGGAAASGPCHKRGIGGRACVYRNDAMLSCAVPGGPVTHPGSAKDWGPTLLAMGFRAHARDGYRAVNGQFNTCSAEAYAPVLADIVVMQGTSASEHEHMAGFNGTAWVSDFVQRDLWPGPSYRKEKPAHAIYRWPH